MAKSKKKALVPSRKSKPKGKKVKKNPAVSSQASKAKRKKVKKITPVRAKVSSERKSRLPAMAEASPTVITVVETACQTGAWTPLKSVTDPVEIGDILGTVVFSGISCDVNSSDSGIVSWIKNRSQVNSGMNVCKVDVA